MAELRIATDGRPLASIITPHHPSAQEQYAADELAHYLRLMTGAHIVCDAEPAAEDTRTGSPGPVIALGAAASRIGVRADDGLGEDGFIVRSGAGGIGIVGGRRGIIYGVYELLEQTGCRFFTPRCERVPCVTNLSIPALDLRQVPVLEYRYHNYTDFVRNPRFAVKNRINGPVPIKDRFGGRMDYHWFVHTFEHILDPAEWFDSHPEYFSMVDGRRVSERTQLCLSNPDVLRITIDKVLAALESDPGKRLISVSQNDWYNYCTCPDCARIDKAEGSYAGSLIRFVNQVAEAVEPRFPDAIIDTLAYQYSRPAPRTRPRHNVCVRLCSIESCFAHPLDACDDPSRRVVRPDGSRSSFIRDLEDWAKVCDRLYIWDYTTCFAHYPAPFPNWRVLQPNMQAFVRNNVRGVFEQACGAVGGSTDLNELRAYLIAKLLWDPDCDVDRHREEFVQTYYGEAAPMVQQYLDTICDVVEQRAIHVGFNDQCDQAYLSDDLLDRYGSILDRAARAVSADPIRSMRVDRIRLSIRWVRLKNRAMRDGVRDQQEVVRFFTDWKAHGLTRIDEWVSAETTHHALVAGLWRGTEFYDHWTAEGPEEL